MKKYPFSVRKYYHNLDFRASRMKNVRYQEQMENKYNGRLDKEIEALDEVMSICIGRPVAWLTGKQLAVAREAVGWAESQRK